MHKNLCKLCFGCETLWWCIRNNCTSCHIWQNLMPFLKNGKQIANCPLIVKFWTDYDFVEWIWQIFCGYLCMEMSIHYLWKSYYLCLKIQDVTPPTRTVPFPLSSLPGRINFLMRCMSHTNWTSRNWLFVLKQPQVDYRYWLRRFYIDGIVGPILILAQMIGAKHVAENNL